MWESITTINQRVPVCSVILFKKSNTIGEAKGTCGGISITHFNCFGTISSAV
jgi:hypothetical protein